MIKISRGNSKLGNIPQINLIPGASCPPGVPCLKDCYCQKALRQYPTTREVWEHNLKAYRTDPAAYFKRIHRYLDNRRTSRDASNLYFRWHSAGDIPDEHYYGQMLVMALRHPEYHLVCYTKNYALPVIKRDIPRNMRLFQSMWPNLDAPDWKIPRAWMQDGTETRIPPGTFECPGKCTGCWACYTGRHKDVVFHKH